jgi:hypothetical protein
MDWQPAQHRSQVRNQSHWGPDRPVPSSVFVELDHQLDPAVGTPTVWPMNVSTPARRIPSPAEHRHLNSLLLVHDALCRQGVARAARLLSQAELAEGIGACIYFDLDELAVAVSEVPLAASTPLTARVFDDEYQRRYGGTDVIVNAILSHMARRSYESPHRPA